MAEIFFYVIVYLAMICNVVLGSALSVDVAASQAMYPNELTWAGSIRPGQLPIVLHGTGISDILAQVLALNPDYEPQPVDNLTIASHRFSRAHATSAKMKSRLAKIGLDDNGVASPIGPRRATEPLPPAKWTYRDDEYTCGSLATGAKADVGDVIWKGLQLGGVCAAPQGKCVRVDCQNETGLYFCTGPRQSPVTNEAQTLNAEAPCALVASYASLIDDLCCSGSEKPSSGLSGMVNPGAWGKDDFVAVGYANCDDRVDSLPQQYEDIPGPNGDCWYKP